MFKPAVRAYGLVVVCVLAAAWGLSLNLRCRRDSAALATITARVDAYCFHAGAELRALSWQLADPAHQKGAALAVIDPHVGDVVELCGPVSAATLRNREACYLREDYACLSEWARQVGIAIAPAMRGE